LGRDGGFGSAGLRIELREPFHQRHDDLDRLGAVRVGRIEIVRLGHVSQVQHLGCVADLHRGPVA